MQDQLCSAFGGINFIEIVQYPRAIVSRVDAADSTLLELNRRLALIYLGDPTARPRYMKGDAGLAAPGP